MKLLAILNTFFMCFFFDQKAQSIENKLTLGRFGEVTIYRAELKKPTQLILFFSGDGGWTKGVVDMARALAGEDSIVVGISTPRYLKNLAKAKESCHYPASDLESLSHYVQKKLGLVHYVMPTLVGYSSGATLVYGTLAQAPANTFRAGMSLGFCPDIEINKPLCKGSGLASKRHKPKGFEFEVRTDLKTPFYVLNGLKDQVCAYDAQKKFLDQIPAAQLITLPSVGHGFSASKNWMPQMLETSKKIASTPNLFVKPPVELGDLPLIEAKANNTKDPLIILLSGDGGWASIDKEIADTLNQKGFSIIGLDSLRYFWSERSPEKLAIDLKNIADYYLKAWNKHRILWVGYSMGADVLPFALQLLPKPTLSMTLGVAYLSLGRTAEFEMHLRNWLVSDEGDNGLPIKPVLQALGQINSLCLFGEQDESSGCEGVTGGKFKALPIPGGHHFGGDYRKLADSIVEHFKI